MRDDIHELIQKAREYQLLAENSTPGPWRVGYIMTLAVNDKETSSNVPKGQCGLCVTDAPYIGEYDEDGRTWHVHLIKDPKFEPWRTIYSESALREVVSFGDSDEGGGVVQLPADADLIASAPDMAWLLGDFADLVEELLNEEE